MVMSCAIKLQKYIFNNFLHFPHYYIEIRLIRRYYAIRGDIKGHVSSDCQVMYFYKEAGQRALQPEVMLLCFLSEDVHIDPVASDKGFYNAL